MTPGPSSHTILVHSGQPCNGNPLRIPSFAFKSHVSGVIITRDALFRVQATGRHLFSSKLLPGLITNHGVSRTPHGGAAILAPRDTSIAFSPEQDITGQYLDLYNSTRVTAIWHQVTPHVRALIWSFYGRTGASSEQDPHLWNNTTLEAIFDISAQFGDIPVIIAGDFQAEPLSYASVTQAIHFAKWEDPFVSFDAEGLPQRILTFSSDRSFSGQEGCSSIDTILINHVTCSALLRAETIETCETQHRPLRIVCHWQKMFMSGFVHHKTAPFVFDTTTSTVDPTLFTNEHAESLWTNQFSQAFTESDDPEDRWAIANDFCVLFMLQNGGRWGQGIKKEANHPNSVARKFVLASPCLEAHRNPVWPPSARLSVFCRNSFFACLDIRARSPTRKFHLILAAMPINC